MEASPTTVALPDLDTANKLRPTRDTFTDGEPITYPPVWPGWPVDTLPTIEGELWKGELRERPVRAGDRVTFTAPCEHYWAAGGMDLPVCTRCGATQFSLVAADPVPVFSAVIDPVPVIGYCDGEDGPHVCHGFSDRYLHTPLDGPEPTETRLPDGLPFTESTRYVLMVRADTIEDV